MFEEHFCLNHTYDKETNAMYVYGVVYFWFMILLFYKKHNIVTIFYQNSMKIFSCLKIILGKSI